MKLFFKFLRRYLGTVIAMVLFTCIFVYVFSLYDLQTEAVIYAAGLCAAVGIVFVIIAFVRFRKRYIERKRLIDEIGMLIEPIAEPKNCEEQQFNEIITMLRSECSRVKTKYDSEKAQMLDYFTTWVHQIKIPISVMQMTLDSSDSDEHRELSAELMRISQYVEMVLYYFRLDEPASDLVAAQVSIDDVIRQSVRKYAAVFIRKRLRLIYEGTQLTAVTDEKWLGFIIEQLLSNSLKYTDNGLVEITVSDMSITVSDTGIGIAKEDIPRIFERGFTGLNGRVDNKSTGLGLYLVNKACKKLGVQISVQSTVGKGTSITLTLPEQK